jgi:hypothetical protein
MLSISTGSAGKFAWKLSPGAGIMRSSNPSVARLWSGMTAKQRVGTAIVLCFGLAIGACSPFSGYMADNWPHWAGGEPAGLPPRPGSPGYAEYIAHGQPTQNSEAAGGTASSPAAVETTQTVSQTPAGTVQKTSIFGGPQVAAPAPRPNVQSPPLAAGTSEDASVVRGGLY